ncbi:MAG: tetratricopeptide repeat protein [Phycisphaerales bacterium]
MSGVHVQRAIDALHAGRADQAEATLRRVIAREPSNAQANHILAAAILIQGRPEQALHFAERATIASGRPNASALDVHATCLAMLNRPADAADVFRRAVNADLTLASAHNGLGASLLQLGEVDQAIAALEHAKSLSPTNTGFTSNLASAYARGWRVPDAIRAIDEAVAAGGPRVDLLTQRASLLNYSSSASREDILSAHRALGDQIERGVRSRGVPITAVPPDVLRVALISPDFRGHSVARFIEPLLRARNVSMLRLIAVSSTSRPDATTERLRALADEWIDIARVNDAQAAELIRKARVDIAIDLAGHTHESRVSVLAHVPAPLRGTYLGYPNTTGMPSVDFRLVDAITDPDGSDVFATERLTRVGGCFLCYQIPPELPPIRTQEDVPNRGVTFGSFNALNKVSPITLDLWARVLGENRDSRLLVKAESLGIESVRLRLLDELENRGVSRDRVELHAQTASAHEHLAMYDRVDVALDTFPYHGTTTTCEALTMGVPVVTLTGDRHASRVGTSILSAIGEHDLIASTTEEYVRKATGLARDSARCTSLRRTLRDRLASSIVCDAEGFAARFDRALREAWTQSAAARHGATP